MDTYKLQQIRPGVYALIKDEQLAECPHRMPMPTFNTITREQAITPRVCSSDCALWHQVNEEAFTLCNGRQIALKTEKKGLNTDTSGAGYSI